MGARPKQVFAACVSPFDSKKEPPMNILAASFYAMIHKAFDGANIIDLVQSAENVLFVEGTKTSCEIGSLLIFRMPLEMIDGAVELYLAVTKDSEGGGTPDHDVMIGAIGSSVFCQDIVRFMGMNHHGEMDSSFEKFMDRIMQSKPIEVVWTDFATEGPFYTGNLMDMFTEAKRAGAIPD